MEENPAFDAFAEEQIGCFWQQLFLFAFSFDERFPVLSRNRSCLTGRELVGTDEVGELFGSAFPTAGSS